MRDERPRLVVRRDDRDRDVADLRMRPDRRFDRSHLDAKTANLHLRVAAPEELERSVRAETADVARRVHPRAGFGGKRVGDETRLGQLGPVDVSEGDAVAPRPDLSGNVDRHGIAPRVEHVDGRVRDRSPDRNRAPPGVGFADDVDRRERRVLRRPVSVHERRFRRPTDERERVRGRHHVAADHDEPHPRERVGFALHELMEERRREHRHARTRAPIERAEIGERQRAARRDGERRSGEERAPDLDRRRVERERRILDDDVAGFERERAAASRETDDPAMGHAHALRRPGRARRVHHVCGLGRGPRRTLRGLARDRRRVGVEIDDRGALGKTRA